MGGVHNKDKFVQIYLTLNQRKYYAGDTVEGAVHILCLEDTPYKYLELKITGHEKVEWMKKYASNYFDLYQNQKDTYFCELKLAEFHDGIQKGQHTFPF
jgi:uncharacterized protein YfaS (alpha-2-macroglobulin family)